MDFRRGIRRDEPEINFIPLIDLLLVILIFLMVTTTYSRFGELQLDLPAAAADRPSQRPRELLVTVSADARYLVDGKLYAFSNPAALAQELLGTTRGRTDVALVIQADAGSTHQSVVNVLEAARLAGLSRVSFTTQTMGGGMSGGSR